MGLSTEIRWCILYLLRISNLKEEVVVNIHQRTDKVHAQILEPRAERSTRWSSWGCWDKVPLWLRYSWEIITWGWCQSLPSQGPGKSERVRGKNRRGMERWSRKRRRAYTPWEEPGFLKRSWKHWGLRGIAHGRKTDQAPPTEGLKHQARDSMSKFRHWYDFVHA